MTKSTPQFLDQARELARDKIHPVVEFFEIDGDENSETSFIDLSSDDGKLLRSHLRKAKGIYAFYNSEYEIIYLGKTKNDLWAEMKNAYHRKMDHYFRYRVHHPREKYSGRSKSLRKISASQLTVAEAATYFSAYHMDDDVLIDIVEMMMIRVLPNDLLNVRMEGNMTLLPFAATLGGDA
jgi:hypothetical protein